MLLGVSAIAAVWILLAATGNPRPHVDDLFFAGTGINVAKGGAFSNPWIAEWMKPFGTDVFFVQPPFHPWCQAVWLKLFGISTLSLLAFQALWGFAASAALLWWLRRLAVGWWACGALQALFIAFLLGFGLRPEPAAIACALLGAIGWQSSDRRGWIAGSLCAACAPVFAPFIATLVVPLGLGWMLRTREPATAWKPAWPDVRAKLMIALGAVALVFVLMCGLIDFRIGPFFETFSRHAELRTPPPGHRIASLWGQMTLGMEPILRWPSLVLFALIAAESLRQGGSPRRVALLALAGAAVFSGVGLFLYAQQVPLYLYPLAMLLSAAMLPLWKPNRRQQLARTLWFATAAWLLLPTGLAWGFGRPAKSPAQANDLARIEATLRQPEARLLLDEYAIRAFFDFRPPANSADWLTSRTQFDGHKSRLSEKPPLEVWLVDGHKLELYVPDSGIRTEKLSLFGRTFSTVLRRPGELHFYP